jgi:hypothetical protein
MTTVAKSYIAQVRNPDDRRDRRRENNDSMSTCDAQTARRASPFARESRATKDCPNTGLHRRLKAWCLDALSNAAFDRALENMRPSDLLRSDGDSVLSSLHRRLSTEIYEALRGPDRSPSSSLVPKGDALALVSAAARVDVEDSVEAFGHKLTWWWRGVDSDSDPYLVPVPDAWDELGEGGILLDALAWQGVVEHLYAAVSRVRRETERAVRGQVEGSEGSFANRALVAGKRLAVYAVSESCSELLERGFAREDYACALHFDGDGRESCRIEHPAFSSKWIVVSWGDDGPGPYPTQITLDGAECYRYSATPPLVFRASRTGALDPGEYGGYMRIAARHTYGRYLHARIEHLFAACGSASRLFEALDPGDRSLVFLEDYGLETVAERLAEGDTEAGRSVRRAAARMLQNRFRPPSRRLREGRPGSGTASPPPFVGDAVVLVGVSGTSNVLHHPVFSYDAPWDNVIELAGTAGIGKRGWFPTGGEIRSHLTLPRASLFGGKRPERGEGDDPNASPDQTRWTSVPGAAMGTATLFEDHRRVSEGIEHFLTYNLAQTGRMLEVFGVPPKPRAEADYAAMAGGYPASLAGKLGPPEGPHGPRRAIGRLNAAALLWWESHLMSTWRACYDAAREDGGEGLRALSRLAQHMGLCTSSHYVRCSPREPCFNVCGRGYRRRVIQRAEVERPTSSTFLVSLVYHEEPPPPPSSSSSSSSSDPSPLLIPVQEKEYRTHTQHFSSRYNSRVPSVARWWSDWYMAPTPSTRSLSVNGYKTVFRALRKESEEHLLLNTGVAEASRREPKERWAPSLAERTSLFNDAWGSHCQADVFLDAMLCFYATLLGASPASSLSPRIGIGIGAEVEVEVEGAPEGALRGEGEIRCAVGTFPLPAAPPARGLSADLALRPFRFDLGAGLQVEPRRADRLRKIWFANVEKGFWDHQTATELARVWRDPVLGEVRNLPEEDSWGGGPLQCRCVHCERLYETVVSKNGCWYALHDRASGRSYASHVLGACEVALRAFRNRRTEGEERFDASAALGPERAERVLAPEEERSAEALARSFEDDFYFPNVALRRTMRELGPGGKFAKRSGRDGSPGVGPDARRCANYTNASAHLHSMLELAIQARIHEQRCLPEGADVPSRPPNAPPAGYLVVYEARSGGERAPVTCDVFRTETSGRIPSVDVSTWPPGADAVRLDAGRPRHRANAALAAVHPSREGLPVSDVLLRSAPDRGAELKTATVRSEVVGVLWEAMSRASTDLSEVFRRGWMSSSPEDEATSPLEDEVTSHCREFLTRYVAWVTRLEAVPPRGEPTSHEPARWRRAELPTFLSPFLDSGRGEGGEGGEGGGGGGGGGGSLREVGRLCGSGADVERWEGASADLTHGEVTFKGGMYLWDALERLLDDYDRARNRTSTASVRVARGLDLVATALEASDLRSPRREGLVSPSNLAPKLVRMFGRPAKEGPDPKPEPNPSTLPEVLVLRLGRPEGAEREIAWLYETLSSRSRRRERRREGSLSRPRNRTVEPAVAKRPRGPWEDEGGSAGPSKRLRPSIRPTERAEVEAEAEVEVEASATSRSPPPSSSLDACEAREIILHLHFYHHRDRDLRPQDGPYDRLVDVAWTELSFVNPCLIYRPSQTDSFLDGVETMVQHFVT